MRQPVPVPRSGRARGMRYTSSRTPLPPAHRRGSRPSWSRIAASTAPWSPPALPLKARPRAGGDRPQLTVLPTASTSRWSPPTLPLKARPRAGGDHPQPKTRLRWPGSSGTTLGCAPTLKPCFPPSPIPGSGPNPSQRRPSGSLPPATPSPTSCHPPPWAHW